jgi:hypothetical protein
METEEWSIEEQRASYQREVQRVAHEHDAAVIEDGKRKVRNFEAGLILWFGIVLGGALIGIFS